MSRSTLASLLALGSFALLGCGSPLERQLVLRLPDTGGPLDPGSAIGEVVVELRYFDSQARLDVDSPLVVTLSHDGTGELIGTTEVAFVEGVARFSDLFYNGCDVFTLRATVTEPDVRSARSGAISVLPQLELLEGPSTSLVEPEVTPLDRIAVRLVGRGGRTVPLDGLPIRLRLGGPDVRFSAGAPFETTTVGGGIAAFEGVTVTGTGSADLTVESGDLTCPLTPVQVGTVVSGTQTRREAGLVPSGLVGVPYSAVVGDASVRAAGLPEGMSIQDGTLTGLPLAFGVFPFLLAKPVDGGMVEISPRTLAVFPNGDPQLPEPVDPAERGAFAVGSLAATLPTVTLPSGTYTDVAMRIAYPMDGGSLASGPRPLVVFLPTVGSPPLFDRYAELHDHWATHGLIVISVDSAMLALDPPSLAGYDDEAALLLAAAAYLEGESDDAGSLFAGAYDPDAVWVAGHGVGGGGALAALRRDPFLAGAILFMPTVPDLLAVPSGAPPAAIAPHPVLTFVGSEDRAVPWPSGDVLGGMLENPYAVITIEGANHLDTVDTGTPNPPLTVSSLPQDERHGVERAFSTAFLRRYAFDELGYEASVHGRRAHETALSSMDVIVRSRRWMATELPISLDIPIEPRLTPAVARSTIYEEPLGLTPLEVETFFPHLLGALEAAWQMETSADLTFPIERGRERMLPLRHRLLFDIAARCDAPPADPMTADPGCALPPYDTVVQIFTVEGNAYRVVHPALEAPIVGRHFRTVSTDLADFRDLDPGQVQTVMVSLWTEDPPFTDGDVWIRDLRFE
ncbi:MAG: hypothetical protein AB7S26_36580 [Sandaracinaceae bacterium]